jgi:hypothetical protein
MIASDASALVFALNKEMTAEDIFKEFNQKVRTCTLPNKLIMQAMISIAMTYEALCATARATAAAANIAYVPHTMVQYLQLIDRPAYAIHVALTDNAFVEAFLYEKKNWIFFLSFLFSKKECFFLSLDKRA